MEKGRYSEKGQKEVITGLGQFWQKLRHSIERRVADRSESLASGKAQDYTTYREVVAEIRTLRWVLDEAALIFGDNKGNRSLNTPTDEDDD